MPGFCRALGRLSGPAGRRAKGIQAGKGGDGAGGIPTGFPRNLRDVPRNRFILPQNFLFPPRNIFILPRISHDLPRFSQGLSKSVVLFAAKLRIKSATTKKTVYFVPQTMGKTQQMAAFPEREHKKLRLPQRADAVRTGGVPIYQGRCPKLFLCCKIYKNHSEHLLIRGGSGAACRTFYGRHHHGAVNRR